MARFHELEVAEVRRETDDTVSVAFQVPEDLKGEFRFIPGQYLTLRRIIGDQDVRRSYSICTSPSEQDLRVAIKEVYRGLFSTYANRELQAGDKLEVMAPAGKFCPDIDPVQTKHYLLIAAGSGITPILSIAKTVLEQEPESTVTLIYGNKGFASIIFREEIEGLKNLYMNRIRLFHVLSRENLGLSLLKGRITAEKLQQFGKVIDYSTIDEAFICGPEEMIQESSMQLEREGIKKDKIHFELFTSPLGKLVAAQRQEPVVDSEKDIEVSLTLDGDNYTFKMSAEKENILDAAMNAGADVPFACKGGVCCTCRAKLLEGEVDMTINYGLEQDEIDNNFILTCQSHPKTKKIVVNFDYTT